MGNTTTGGRASIFGLTPEQEALFGGYTPPPAPINEPIEPVIPKTPTPEPIAPLPPPPLPPPLISPSPGPVSGSIGGGNTGTETTMAPGSTPPSGPVSGILSPPSNLPISNPTGTAGISGNGPVSGIIGGGTGTALAGNASDNTPSKANPNEVRPSWMIGSWKPEEAYNQKQMYERIPESVKYNQGLVSNAVNTPAAPTPTVAPVTPSPVAPAPTPVAKKKTPKAAETDPYERWKQLGRPGGSFEEWKGSQ